MVFLVIYLIALAFLQWRNLQYPLNGDRVGELRHFYHKLYGEPVDDAEAMLASCPLVITLPYLLSRVFKLSRKGSYRCFRLVPAFFHAGLPAFGYLIGLHYLSPPYAILMAVMLIANPFFFLYSDLGRGGIAWGMLAGLYWAILEGNIWLVALFSGLMIMGHYATALQFLFILGGAGAISILTQTNQWLITVYAIYFSILYLWQNVARNFVGRRVSFFVMAALGDKSSASEINMETTEKPFLQQRRDPIVQRALFLEWGTMKLPQKVELLTSWALVAVMIAGLSRPSLDGGYLLALMSLVAVAIAVIVPHISFYYGVMRALVISTFFMAPLGVSVIEKLGWGIPLLILIIVHILLVSGLLHPAWYIDKYRELRTYSGNR